MHSQKITVWYLMWYICLCTHLYVPIHTLPWFYTQWWWITPTTILLICLWQSFAI